MYRTVTIFLYFSDLLLFINKRWWQGSAPISCTLPHSKALAHWRQVRRNYLFQGGYPRYHLICTPPRRGSPSWFPQSPGTVGYGPHPWRQVWNFYSRVATLGTTWSVLPPGGPPSWAPTSSHPSLPPIFYPKPVYYFQLYYRKWHLRLGLERGSLSEGIFLNDLFSGSCALKADKPLTRWKRGLFY